MQAQDRLFQMDLWRRFGAGTAVGGASGPNFIERDAMTRRDAVPRRSVRGVGELRT